MAPVRPASRPEPGRSVAPEPARPQLAAPEPAGSEPARSRGPGANAVGRVTAASTLWLLVAIVVLFAAAVVLLAVTVRGLCVTAALPS
jgi:hypothetical protein